MEIEVEVDVMVGTAGDEKVEQGQELPSFGFEVGGVTRGVRGAGLCEHGRSSDESSG